MMTSCLGAKSKKNQEEWARLEERRLKRLLCFGLLYWLTFSSFCVYFFVNISFIFDLVFWSCSIGICPCISLYFEGCN